MTLHGDTANSKATAEPARHAWLHDAADDESVVPATPRRISIFGLGYVGAVSLACLARDGHEMTGVDIDESKLEMLRRGQAPIVETGIQELTRNIIRSGKVTVTNSVRDAILGDRCVVRLRGHAGAHQRQPEPGCHHARGGADRRRARREGDTPRHRSALDRQARHCRGSHPASARSCVGAARPASTSACASSRSSCAKARRSTTTIIRR